MFDENEEMMIEDYQRQNALLLVGIACYYFERFNEQWNKVFHSQKG